jgi:hypothetical protein
MSLEYFQRLAREQLAAMSRDQLLLELEKACDAAAMWMRLFHEMRDKYEAVRPPTRAELGKP